MNSNSTPSTSPRGDEAQQPPAFADGNQFYYDAYGWYEHSCTQVGHPNSHTDPVRALACYLRKELIWIATASGMLDAHHAPDMERIVSINVGEPTPHPVNTSDVRDVVVSDSSVLAAVSYGLAVVKSGVVLSASLCADAVRNAKPSALKPMSDNQVCTGGESCMLALIDLQPQRILRQAPLCGATGMPAAVWAAP